MTKTILNISVKVLFVLFILGTLMILGFTYYDVQVSWISSFIIIYLFITAILLVYTLVKSFRRFIKLKPRAIAIRIGYGILIAAALSLMDLLLDREVSIFKILTVILCASVLELFFTSKKEEHNN